MNECQIKLFYADKEFCKKKNLKKYIVIKINYKCIYNILKYKIKFIVRKTL